MANTRLRGFEDRFALEGTMPRVHRQPLSVCDATVASGEVDPTDDQIAKVR